ncbi:MAG: ABC transporter permease subunit, partial [Phycisphaerae bacterium]
LPAAYVVGRVRRLGDRPLITAMLMVALLSPPMVCALGWEQIGARAPGFSDGSLRGATAELWAWLRCIGVWAMWAWPVPAVLLGAGWSAGGRRVYEAARLETSAWGAFRHAALPGLIRHVALSALILFVLFFGEYGVPHACGLVVYATELLGWAQESADVIHAVWPAVPAIGVVAVTLMGLWILNPLRPGGDNGDAPPAGGTGGVGRPGIVAAGVVGITWLLPITVLVIGHMSWSVLAEAFRVYGFDLLWSIGVCGTSGSVAVGMGLAIVRVPRLRAAGLLWTVVLGTVPGALIGEMMVAAYNHEATRLVYDDWPVLVLCYVARFGWIGVATAWTALSGTARPLIEQARTDGAGQGAVFFRVILPVSWPVLLAGAGVTTALALADVSASALVRVPRFSPIAHVLIEKFHRFEFGMLVSLSLWLVAAALVPTVLLAFALKARSRRA